MRVEYKAIVTPGSCCRSRPDLADGWQIQSGMTVPEYRKFAQLRIEALNHALRDIPESSVRFHMCWGSYKGPHIHDIPLADIVDIILDVKAEGYSIEASNPRHDHEWAVWKDVKLPEGKLLIPAWLAPRTTSSSTSCGAALVRLRGGGEARDVMAAGLRSALGGAREGVLRRVRVAGGGASWQTGRLGVA